MKKVNQYFMNYLLVCSDKISKNNIPVPAKNIVNFRLSLGKWGLYQNTPHKFEIQKNDRCIIYIAGKYENKQSFVSNFVVTNVEKNENLKNYEEEQLNIKSTKSVLDIIFEPTTVKNVVSVRDLLGKLDLTKNVKTINWGVSFIGGVKKLSDNDYNIISNLITQNGR